VTILSGQQLFQQATAHLRHRGTHRQLQRLQAVTGSTRRYGQRREPVYLGGDLRPDLLVEPPYLM
jgi:hypothetical protein